MQLLRGNFSFKSTSSCKSILRQKFLYPVCMLGKRLICPQAHTVKKCLFECRHLVFQTCRKHRKPHNLDQTDIFLLNVVQLRMWMVYPKRMFCRCNIVPKHQIEFVVLPTSSRDRRDRVVRLSVRLGIDKCILVRIASPCRKNLIRQLNQTFFLRRTDPDNGHRPFHNAGFYIFKSCKGKFPLFRCLRHGKFIMTTLEMVMA